MAAPANMVSGICGMEHVVQGGNTVLYTATRAGGGVLALDVDAEKVVVDQVVTALGATLPTQATLELLRVNGALQLVVTGANQAKVQTQALQANGALVAPVYLVGSLSGTLSAQSVVQIGGSTYFYAARAGESTIRAYSVAANGTMTLIGTKVLGGARAGVDLAELTPATVGGQSFLISLSLAGDMVQAFPIGAGGAQTIPSVCSAAQGLEVADPSAVKVVQTGGVTHLLVASVGAPSVSVIEIAPGGVMRVADHVVDTLETRFQGAQQNRANTSTQMTGLSSQPFGVFFQVAPFCNSAEKSQIDAPNRTRIPDAVDPGQDDGDSYCRDYRRLINLLTRLRNGQN